MFTTHIQPRVSETDGVGHINNTVVPAWFEAGREPIFRLFNPELTFHDWRMVVVHFSIDFVKELRLGSEVLVCTWIKRIGNTSFEIYEELHQNGEVCAKGTSTYVNYSKQHRKTEPIPPNIRFILEQHLIAEL